MTYKCLNDNKITKKNSLEFETGKIIGGLLFLNFKNPVYKVIFRK